MRCLYALVGFSILFAACSETGTGPADPVGPSNTPGPLPYNEVSSGSGWIRADKDDYAPGETITILAGGWEPGETVVMALAEEPDVQEDLVLTSIADADGNFVNTDFGVTEIHLGVVFTLSAEGQSSSMTASTMFNDGAISNASIQMRNAATCTTAQGSVNVGSPICAHASFTISGTGTTHAQFRWKNPSGTVVAISQRPSFQNGTLGAQTYSANFTPTVSGTWTVLLCESNNSDPGAGGGGVCASGSQKASQTFQVNIADTQAPTVNCTVPDQTIWYDDNVTVNCTGSDASGLANPADAAFSLSTSVAAGNETANAQTGSKQVCDTANPANCTTAGPYTFMVDRKGPSISCGSADGAWHAEAVSIACTASDGGSGLAVTGDASFSLSTSVPAGTETSNASTGSQNVCDDVGNCATAGPIGGNMIDKKAPSVSCGTADGFWHATDVSIACSAADGGAGLANAGDANFSLSTSVPAGTETINASTDSRNVCDDVGNCATAGPIGGIMVDKKGPVVTLTCPATPVILGSSASASWTAADGGSGVALGYDSGTPITLDTSSVGAKTANVPAGTSKDNVDNQSAEASCGYSVIYDWNGFFRPVDNLPTWNVTKAGSAIPVKFSLAGDQGLNIFASGYPKSQKVYCDSSSPFDVIEETMTAGGSSLSYDPVEDQYVYVWKSEKTWGGTCRQLTVTLDDGTTHQANFKFNK